MKAQRGMTLVELLVGMTISLFLMAGAAALMTQQLHEHRQLLAQTQLQADLRALQVLLRRELRLAGAWGEPGASMWTPETGLPRANPYDTVEVRADELRFSTSQAVSDPSQREDQRLDDADRKALRWRGATLEFRTDGGRFQPLNDPSSVAIRRFKAEVEHVATEAELTCAKPCGAAAQCPPRVTVQTLRIQLDAEVARDPRVRRTVDWRIPIDSPRLEGQCAA